MGEGGVELVKFNLRFFELRETIAKAEDEKAIAGLGGEGGDGGGEFGDGGEVLSGGELIDDGVGGVEEEAGFGFGVDGGGGLNDGGGFVVGDIDVEEGKDVIVAGERGG